MHKYYIIRPSGEVIITELEKQPELKALQQEVGGYIEYLSVEFQGKRAHAYVNENGKHMRLPANAKATAVWHNDIQPGNPDAYNDLTQDPINHISPWTDKVLGTMVIWTGPIE